MADIENEKPRRRKNESNETAETADNETFVQASLKDLVSSATQALGHLLADEAMSDQPAAPAEAAAPEVAATPDDTELNPEMTAAEISETTERVVDAIEWNAETTDLAFTEADGSESEVAMDENDAVVEHLADESADVSDRSSRLQELARLVAKTVSERKMEMTDVHDVDGTELADGKMMAEQTEPEQMGFEALEEELDAADNDADPEPTEFVENNQLISIVESLLFSTDKPVSLATLKSLFKGTNVRTKDIARALDILASEYASPTRGVSLEEINGGYQLRTKVDNTDFLKRLQKVRPFRLSGPALETMAIVAYKQPVTKYEIDEIRGVESGHLLRALMERGMVQFQGKAEDKPGKPMAYGSTRKFLETFGLRNLRELPTLSEIDELLPEGIGEVEEKEKLSDITEELSNEFSGGYSESEEELSKINETLQAIDTSSEFFEQEKLRERERRDRDRAQDIRERIVLGDSVDPKDQRWLDRYEAKLHAQDQAVTSGTPITIPGDEIENAEPIGDALEALTNESGADGEKMAATARGDHDELSEVDAELSEDDDEPTGDLGSNLDWDDDDEAADEDTSNDV